MGARPSGRPPADAGPCLPVRYATDLRVHSEAAAAAALKVSRQVLVTLRKLAAKNNPSERRKVAGPIQRLTDAERD
jgi:hypothetical protein